MFGNFKIDLIVVGNLKEKALVSLNDEYLKRLKSYCNLNVIELKDISNKQDSKTVLKEEAKQILNVLDKNSYIITMEIEGKNLSSVEFAEKIKQIITYDNSKISFIIGGSLGISDEIKEISNYKLSFSNLTFPHQLFRIMLLEQIYRTFRINNNEPYHK